MWLITFSRETVHMAKSQPRKEPIRMLGFTSRLPYPIIKGYLFLSVASIPMDSVLVWNRSRKLFLKHKFTNQVRPLKNIDCCLKWFVRPSEVPCILIMAFLFVTCKTGQALLNRMYCSAGLLFRGEGRGGYMHHMTSWSCSEPFLVVGLVGYFYILLGKTRFQPVWLINFFS